MMRRIGIAITHKIDTVSAVFDFKTVKNDIADALPNT